jgi:hypothetical protein
MNANNAPAVTLPPHLQPSPAMLAVALESMAATLEQSAESTKQLAAHACGLPLVELTEMIHRLHVAVEHSENVAEVLMRRMLAGRRGRAS